MAAADPDHLQAIKTRLADVAGIENLSVTMVGGRMVFGINGKTIGLTPFASEDEIEAAIRLSLAAPIAPATPPAPIPTPMPMPAATEAVVEPAPAAAPTTAPAPKAKPVPAVGSFAASLKAMMNEALAGVEQAKENGASKVRAKVAMLNEAKTAVVRVTDNMAQNIEDQANSVMAELGQISNDLTGEAD